MAFGFATFEKLKEIFNAVRLVAWWFVPFIGLIMWVKWWMFTWLPHRAISAIDWVKAMLPATELDLGAVNIGWSRINQWVPLNEIVFYGAAYILILSALALLKWLRKLVWFT